MLWTSQTRCNGWGDKQGKIIRCKHQKHIVDIRTPDIPAPSLISPYTDSCCPFPCPFPSLAAASRAVPPRRPPRLANSTGPSDVAARFSISFWSQYLTQTQQPLHPPSLRATKYSATATRAAASAAVRSHDHGHGSGHRWVPSQWPWQSQQPQHLRQTAAASPPRPPRRGRRARPKGGHPISPSSRPRPPGCGRSGRRARRTPCAGRRPAS